MDTKINKSWVLRALVSCAAATLVACGGSPTRRINPPVASIQQLNTADGDSWRIELRVQNFSTVPMHFGHVAADLAVATTPAVHFDAPLDLDIPAQSAEVVSVRFTPSAPMRAAVASVRKPSEGLVYSLAGTIFVTEPEKEFTFNFDSQLTPVPGRPGAFR